MNSTISTQGKLNSAIETFSTKVSKCSNSGGHSVCNSRNLERYYNQTDSGNTSLESFSNTASSYKKKRQPKNKRQESEKVAKSAFFGQYSVMSDYSSSYGPEQESDNDSGYFFASEDLRHEKIKNHSGQQRLLSFEDEFEYTKFAVV